MDEKRAIIALTLSNMSQIYKDVSRILETSEVLMKNSKFRPQGDAASTWGVSGSYDNPEGWLYRWFARAYSKHDLKKFVGLVIHLGSYQQEWVRKLDLLSVGFPFVQVSLLELDPEPRTIYRPSLYNDLWGIAWNDPAVVEKRGNVITIPSAKSQTGSMAQVTSYFVDLLSINTKEKIEQLITEPMNKMFHGQKEWVNEQKLPVIEPIIQN